MVLWYPGLAGDKGKWKSTLMNMGEWRNRPDAMQWMLTAALVLPTCRGLRVLGILNFVFLIWWQYFIQLPQQYNLCVHSYVWYYMLNVWVHTHTHAHILFVYIFWVVPCHWMCHIISPSLGLYLWCFNCCGLLRKNSGWLNTKQYSSAKWRPNAKMVPCVQK